MNKDRRSVYRSFGVDDCIIPFAFAPNGTSDPGISGEGCAGLVKSIVHTATGVFTITLSHRFKAIKYADAAIGMGTHADLKPQWGACNVDVDGGGTLVLNILAVNTLTDIAAATGNIIYVLLVLRNSVVTP